jgi:phage major tail protein 2|nr:MAG TPA: tail tube protein [Caudoviricetes sp.]
MPTGYIHGSNLLIFVGGKAIGHCSTCEITHNTESKERAVKPPAKQAGGNTGKWTEKSVTKLSESLSAEGFCFYDETECGYNELLALWQKAEPVDVKYNHRGEDSTRYRGGKYVITNLSQTRPADDDASYKVSLESTGEIKSYPA